MFLRRNGKCVAVSVEGNGDWAADDARVMARMVKGDSATLAALFEEQVIGRPVTIALDADRHSFAIAT
jgi:hypothetical protein